MSKETVEKMESLLKGFKANGTIQETNENVLTDEEKKTLTTISKSGNNGITYDEEKMARLFRFQFIEVNGEKAYSTSAGDQIVKSMTS